MPTRSQSNILIAILLVIGIVLSGWFVGDGFRDGRADARYVTVKGLSERDVQADLALWPIRFVVAGNDLNSVQQQLKEDRNTVQNFLVKYNIPEKVVELQDLEVTDRTAQSYQSGNYKNRFILAQTLMVRSNNVDQIDKASQNIGELVEAGVILNSDYSGSGPTYLFNGLTDLKPKMIAEATKNARNSAQQFADDAGSELGGIRRARQGVFQVLARDKAPMLDEKKQINKTVRVVSTLEYYLTD